jgi:hypothetical protein
MPASDFPFHFQDDHFIEEQRLNCGTWKLKGEDDVEGTKGEALNYVSKKERMRMSRERGEIRDYDVTR